MELKEIIKLSREALGEAPLGIERLGGAGSSRRYYRLTYATQTLIATVGDDLSENRTFCRLARVFSMRSQHGGGSWRVPRILAHTADFSVYIQEDFGDTPLLGMLLQHKTGSAEMMRRVLDCLLDLQLTPCEQWEGITYAAPFGRRRVAGDLDYFRFCFLRPSGVAFDDDLLAEELERLAGSICDYPDWMSGFMYRDFQSRNILVLPPDGKPGFIDFQGGMRGPMPYDAVSLLWQAKAGFPDRLRRELLEYYIKELCRLKGMPEDEVREVAGRMVLLRTLQVLGAYGFRGLVERKAHFIESIPAALDNLREVVATGIIDAYPELRRVCLALTELERFRPSRHEGLLVEVWSFSFKKGYPENLTGNGGGFVFDCRGMHNPGRYEEFRRLTGGDRPVIDFLEERGEVQDFMTHASGLVLPTVDTYLRRGFSDLQVAFGCTGGQHRSFYCAEQMCRILRTRYPDLAIRLIHREQGIDKIY